MFLIERIFGVCTYALVTIVFYVLIDNPRVKRKHMYIMYTFALCIMGMLLVPYVTNDLYRIYGILDIVRPLSFEQLYNNIMKTSSNPAIYIYYWLISKTGIKQLLPAITCFICHSCIFYVFTDMEKRYKISSHNIAVVFLLTMSTGNYISIVTGIKMMLALSALTACFYREIIMKKFKLWHILVYAIALFTHNIVIVVLAIRLAVLLISARIKLRYKIIAGVASLVAFLLVVTLFTKGFTAMFENGYSYLVDEGHYVDFWEYIVSSIIFILEIIMLLRMRRISSVNNISTKSANTISFYLLLTLCVAFAVCWAFTLFYRLTVSFGMLLSIPLMMICAQSSSEQIDRTKARLSFRTILILFSIIIFALEGTRGFISSLKFFVL